MLALLTMLSADSIAEDRLDASLMLAHHTIRLATSLMIHASIISTFAILAIFILSVL